MKRRTFFTASAAGLILPTLLTKNGAAFNPADFKGKKVGLVGSGWYGKSALLRSLQVAPLEVVALCDVDSQMLSEAADLVATRQENKQKPRTYSDYRKMLEQEDLDIVQVSTPDHWHALPVIAALQAGKDVYMEKPISVDVIEGQAMLAAARKYKRVVQVNMQRRSTPHLVEAKKNIIQEGKLGKIGLVECYCYYHMRARGNPAVTTPPDTFDYDMWAGPAPKRPYVPVVHPKSWRAFMEYGNGIVGDMCVHMYDMVRWLLDIGFANRIHSSGGIYVDKESIANITDTQSATFEHDDFDVVWQHRSYGAAPDPEYPWGATIYGDKGTLKLSVQKWDFIPQGRGEKLHQDVVMELEEFSEDKTEDGLEKHVAPAMRQHWKDFLTCTQTREDPVSNIEEGYISATSCILANMSQELGRSFDWDADNGRIVGDDEANKKLARPYRDPWIHPDPNNV